LGQTLSNDRAQWRGRVGKAQLEIHAIDFLVPASRFF
jgi:hypothetical protein